MVLLSIRELLDIIIMTAAVAYIFMDFFRIARGGSRDVFIQYQGFDWKSFYLAAAVTAPALIFHELAHKFVAIGFGMNATFHAAYFWLLIGVALKLMRTKFIFFVPGFVTPCSFPAGSPELATCLAALTQIPLRQTLIAFAGPFLNLALFLAAWLALANIKNMSKNTFVILHLTKQINLLLFIFNMLPIPLFDGFKVYEGLFQIFF